MAVLRSPNALFEPSGQPAARRSLTTELVDAIRLQIESAELRVGDRLATEAEMVQRFNVSRTVVREALSKLQAAGLVETRHGIGTFVCEAQPRSLFRLDPEDVAGSIDALAVLELRISLETESAGLAAARCDKTQIAEMRQALTEFEHNVGEATETISPDIRFHLAIANATGNRYFVEILKHLGMHMIPRTRITRTQIPPVQYAEYLTRVNREHEQICDAIERGDADSARTAMRLHLINSRERLRRAKENS
ncbi:GntR family transcriptional regulator [Burkholderia sp. Leaf177]|uniref:FadR/GntR family transcriptional regulator n=1 Tax=Burkholderia sp. Leaf177 TaxID=1736287 RepID=UPI0006FFE01B|nr:GntR family transcriptional regulator [Burkholderia sp. Leaf177]